MSSRSQNVGASASWYLFTLTSILCLLSSCWAATPKTVEYTETDGTAILLLDDRKPALYTQNFGDCLGSSAINVTRFDAAYYKDNMTVAFHLQGNTAVANESLMCTYSQRKSKLKLTFASVYWRLCLRRSPF